MYARSPTLSRINSHQDIRLGVRPPYSRIEDVASIIGHRSIALFWGCIYTGRTRTLSNINKFIVEKWYVATITNSVRLTQLPSGVQICVIRLGSKPDFVYGVVKRVGRRKPAQVTGGLDLTQTTPPCSLSEERRDHCKRYYEPHTYKAIDEGL